MLTDNGKHVNGKAWHFKLLMMYPTASQIHFKSNTQNKNNLLSFLPKLKKFYQDLFSLTIETKKTIALAVEHDISSSLLVSYVKSMQFWNLSGEQTNNS
jgi:hypothetical protein